MGSRASPNSSSDTIQALVDMLYDALDWPKWSRFGFFANAFRGLLMFMGLKVKAHRNTFLPDADPDSILTALVELIKNPGYYVVVLKQVFREITNITNGFAAFQFSTNIAAVVSGLLGIFEAIRESATWKFILILSNLGEQAARATILRPKAPWIGQSEASSLAEGKNYAKDAVPDIRKYRSLNRVKTNKEIKSRSALSLHTFRSVILSGQPYGSSPGTDVLINLNNLNELGSEIGDSYSDLIKVSNDKSAVAPLTRIPKELVEIYEKQMNSEYCPFYIQDLRNNEIIQMPAFISQLNDNFSAEYTSTTGYGRTDSVKTYTRTNRQIQIGIKLVAMSKEDHTHMWFIVNRLVAMLYPQRSLGRLRNMPGKSTKLQPFSQVPTSSPMVRLRLGDLYRSNYTDSAFAKMLGWPGHLNPPDGNKGQLFTEDDMKVLQVFNSSMPVYVRNTKEKIVSEFRTTMNEPKATPEDKLKAINKILGKDKDQPYTGHLAMKAGSEIYIRGYKAPNPLAVLGALLGGGDSTEKTEDPDFKLKEAVIAKPIAGYADGKRMHLGCQTSSLDPNKNKELKEFVESVNEAKKKAEKDELKDEDGKPIKAAVAKDYQIRKEIKKRSEKKEIKRILTICGQGTGAVIKKISDIYESDSSKNILLCFDASKTGNYSVMPTAKIIYDHESFPTKIGDLLKKQNDEDKMKELRKFIQNDDMYKFFKENAGYGLAGFITQMSLEYGDSTWEIDRGSKAPKKIEISLSFDPIHDLTPGLDNSGRMANPIFPVGEYSGGNLDPWTKEVSEHSIFEQPTTMMVSAKLNDQPIEEPEPKGFPGNLL